MILKRKFSKNYEECLLSCKKKKLDNNDDFLDNDSLLIGV